MLSKQVYYYHMYFAFGRNRFTYG